MEQIKIWGIANIAESLAQISEKIAGHLAKLGCRLPEQAERCPHMFGAQLPEGYAGNLVAELRERNIFISQRGNALRFAPHLHINDADVDHLLLALTDIIG